MSAKKKVVWGLGILFVLFSVTATVLYFYAINNAEKSLETLVDKQSDGKLALKISKVKIELSKLSFKFYQPYLQTKDSLKGETGYHIQAQNISISFSSIFKFIFKRKVVVASVVIDKPEIVVIKYKAGAAKKVSLTTEMGLVYQSLEQVLKVFEINYLHIDDATFMLIDKTIANGNPIVAKKLYLTINKAKIKDTKNSDRIFFTDNIQFDSYNQDLELKDGLNSLHYKHLSISSGNKFLKLDSCHFSINNGTASNSKFDVSLDSISVLNVDYNLLLKDGLLKLDSAVCYNPKINMQLELAEKKKKSNLLRDSLIDKEAVEHYFKKAFGDLDIGYLAVNNAQVNVKVLGNNQSSGYASEKINISFTNLAVIDQPAVPLRLDKFALAIKGYTAYTPDSLYTMMFDSVVVEKQKIALTNFSLKPSNTKQATEVRSIVAKSFELNQINWNELFYNQQLVADNIALIKPEVSLSLSEPKIDKDVKVKSKAANSFSFLQDKIAITNFFLTDGSVNVTIGNATSASVSNCFAKVKVEKLLNDNSIENIVAAVTNLSFAKGTFANAKDSIELTGLTYTGLNGNLAIKKFSQLKVDKSSSIQLAGIALNQIQLNKNNDFVVGNLGWTSASIAINKKQKDVTSVQTKTKLKNEFKLLVNQLNGGAVNFTLKSADLNLTAKLNSIYSDEITLTEAQQPEINNLHVDGQLLTFNQKKINGTVSAFSIKDRQASFLKNVKLNMETATENVKLQLPEVQFALDINSCLKGTITADFVTLNQPEISFEPVKKTTTVSAAKSKPLPKFNVGRIEINDPRFVNQPKNITDKMQLVLGSARLQINALSSNGEAIAANDLHVRLKNFGFGNEKIKLTPTGNEAVQIDASNLVFKTATTSGNKQWHINLDTVIASNIIVNITSIKQAKSSLEVAGISKEELKNPYAPSISKSSSLISENEKSFKSQLRNFTDSLGTPIVILRELNEDTTLQTITVTRFDLRNVELNADKGTELKNLLANNSDFKIVNSTLQMENNKSKISFANLNFNASTKAMKMDNFGFEPAMNKENFMLTKAVQTAYMKLNTGKIKANHFDISSLINEKTILIQNVSADSVHLYVYKDKRLPYNYLEKPMLTELIGKIPMRTNLDTVNLTLATIEYEETNDKTLLNGSVSFTDLKGRITKMKNYDITETDSLKFKVSSRFMNATTLKVNYAQSYYDSLAAFNITVHISPFELNALNPLIGPTVSAKINSGYLDTISMNAIGRRHVSYGAMKMYYHDLNIEYLDKGDEVHKTLKTRLVTFFADAVVKNNNTKGTGSVYAERVLDKGFPNYWLRILLSGVITNTGLRTNKKQEKKYYQSIKKYDVPPIPEVTLD